MRAATTGDGFRTGGIVADNRDRRVGSRERQKTAGALQEHRSLEQYPIQDGRSTTENVQCETSDVVAVFLLENW